MVYSPFVIYPLPPSKLLPSPLPSSILHPLFPLLLAGLNYKVLPRLNTCKISPINYNISWGDVEVGEDGSIHMTSPWNLEGLAEPMQYNGLVRDEGGACLFVCFRGCLFVFVSAVL